MNQKNFNSKSQREAFLVVFTHWDREWYEPFQVFRYQLVEFMDELLEVMTRDPGFSHFQMDGQAVPIEDYLEIRPEKESVIRELAQAGRLAIGPWYTLPDEFIPSGEALIRNLQEGLRVASRFGRPSKGGFVCDMFGHISQMPQIYQGFGIKTAFMWRGINEATAGARFRWRSPDGSEVLASRLGPIGYFDYFNEVRSAAYSMDNPVFEGMVARLKDYIQRQATRIPGNLPLLLLDGVDQTRIESLTSKLIEVFMQSELGEKFDLKLATLDQYADALEKQKDAIGSVVEGEMREVLRPRGMLSNAVNPTLEELVENRKQAERGGERRDENYVLPGVLSSRIVLKQANARCEALLTQWAEPFSLFAALDGFEYPEGFLRTAWRYVVANHAHDSICGCSSDQTHKDVLHRFEQAEVIARQLKKKALESLAKQVVAGPAGKKPAENVNGLIILFNPTAQTIDEPVDFAVELPEKTPCYEDFMLMFEPKPGFRLVEAEGKLLPYQRVSQEKVAPYFVTPHYHVDVTAKVQIPAFGYTTIGVAPEKAPTRYGGKNLLTGALSAENEYLAIEFTAGGLMNLTDKRSGERYENLLRLEDRADIGDGWNHGIAVNDEVHYSDAGVASVACIAEGHLRVTFRIELKWALPGHFDFHQMRRSDERRELKLTHEVTLRAGCPRVEVRTMVKNEIHDHRLRVMFPTRVAADHYWTDSAFDVIKRPVALPEEHFEWRELEVETRPQRNWTAIAEKSRGLAVITAGLLETTVRDLAERPIALTLLRGFQKVFFRTNDTNSQAPGDYIFGYWIVPLEGAPDNANLFRLAQRLSAGIGQTAHQLDEKASWPNRPPRDPRPQRDFPAQLQFLSVKGDVVITALKASAGGKWLIRLFNPQSKTVVCEISRPVNIRQAWNCDLNEEPRGELALQGGKLVLESPPRKIISLLFE